MQDYNLEEKGYSIFLDDYRQPVNCVGYVHMFGLRPDTYINREWVVVKNYLEFVNYIKEHGLPKLLSFDHDLADIHYQVDNEDWKFHTSEQLSVEETGLDCAQWLIDYCINNKLKLPEYMVHSMNPVGRENINKLLANYKKHEEESEGS